MLLLIFRHFGAIILWFALIKLFLFSAVVSDDSLVDYLCTKMKERALDLQQF